jgi:hypothetical protein
VALAGGGTGRLAVVEELQRFAAYHDATVAAEGEPGPVGAVCTRMPHSVHCIVGDRTSHSPEISYRRRPAPIPAARS